MSSESSKPPLSNSNHTLSISNHTLSNPDHTLSDHTTAKPDLVKNDPTEQSLLNRNPLEQDLPEQKTVDPHRDRKHWRSALRERRRHVTAEQMQQAPTAIARQLCNSALWHGQSIALYVAGDGEIDPSKIALAAQAAGKALYLPVIEAPGKMYFARWEAGETLLPNRLGIGEPADKTRRAVSIDLLLMPLVGWTGQGFRLGMGGGYYDRFLASDAANGAFRLGLGYECQHESALDALRQEWDAPLDGVLTERRLLRFD